MKGLDFYPPLPFRPRYLENREIKNPKVLSPLTVPGITYSLKEDSIGSTRKNYIKIYFNKYYLETMSNLIKVIFRKNSSVSFFVKCTSFHVP